MFGYIVFNQDELKFKEYKLYRSYYCGLCRVLKNRYGRSGQMTLSYDTTFLALLLSSLYEPVDEVSETSCIVHPFEKHPTRINPYVEYAADINLILSYYSSRDDWSDEHSVRKLVLSRLLAGKQQRACADYEDKAAVIKEQLNLLHRAESEGVRDIDTVSGYFGTMMADVFAIKDDEWAATLKRMGFYLGKFIYILDAFDDLEQDHRKKSYNPFLKEDGSLPFTVGDESAESFCEEVRMILTMMMAECCKCFETLPILNHIEILRNILYSGVWSKYEEAASRYTKKNAEDREQTIQKEV